MTKHREFDYYEDDWDEEHEMPYPGFDIYDDEWDFFDDEEDYDIEGEDLDW